MKYLIFIFLSVGSVIFLFFSCTSQSVRTGVFESRGVAEQAQQSGVFASRAGRLESEELCFNNEDCVELCDSMLKKSSDQKNCYEYAENKVQLLRDTYNNLTIGSPKRLSDITPDDLEELLEFGHVLWLDAISGFDRADDSYSQRGYTRQGTAHVLSFIARNDWVADLLLKYDKESQVMQKLLSSLFEPAVFSKYSDTTKQKIRTCPSNTCASDLGFATLDNCKNQTEQSSPINNKQLRALLSKCLDDGLDYISLSVRKKNSNSQKLGEEVVDAICDNSSSCDTDFKNAILEVFKETLDASVVREIICKTKVGNVNSNNCRLEPDERSALCTLFNSINPNFCTVPLNCNSGTPTCN